MSASRLLPPLILLAALALIVGRCAGQPYRAESQAQITGLLEGADLPAAEARLGDYLRRYDEPEDHWFATSAWFAMHRPGKAIDQIWGHPTLPADPATARRFAETALLALGWSDRARLNATGMEPNALIALVEGGHPWATERLHEHASTLELAGCTLYFFPAYRRATSPPLDEIVDAFRARGDEKFDVAAGLGALHLADYPKKAADLKLLQHVVASRNWRQQYLSVWAVASVALGRSGDPDALRTLREVAASMEGATSPQDVEALALVRNGLVAGGDWSVEEAQLERAFAEDASPMPTLWLLEALIHRYRVGDMRAEAGLVRYWIELGERFPEIRARMARALLLHDEPPSAEAQAHWVGRMVADLERPGGTLMSRILAAAWRLRQGADGARENLVDALRVAGEAFEAEPDKIGELTQPFLEALRALYLYG